MYFKPIAESTWGTTRHEVLDTEGGKSVGFVHVNPDGEASFYGNPNTVLTTAEMRDIMQFLDQIVNGEKCQEMPDKTPTIVALADSVVARLNELSLPLRPDSIAISFCDPPRKPLNQGELRVSVIPREVEYLPLDRTCNKLHLEIEIFISKRMASAEPSEIVPLMAFVEEISDKFRLKRVGLARCIKAVQGSPIVAQNQFDIWITLTFEMAK